MSAQLQQTIYVTEEDRYVVSLIVGYGNGDGVASPEEAAAAALDLTRDLGSSDTVWFVYDRQTDNTHRLEQADFEEGVAT